jgi:hypothetical protein
MLLNHPGHWQQFQLRPDNRGLSVMEMKSKYLHEQYLFEAQMITLNQMHQQNAFMNGGGGGPASTPEPTPEPTYTTSLQLVFNDTLENMTSNYGFDVTSAAAWNESGKFTFNDNPSNFETVEIVDNYTINLKGNEEGISVIDDTFSGDAYLTYIEDINANCISEVKSGAFFQAGLLERAVLDNVTTIGLGAFGECQSLTSVRFGTLTTIPNGGSSEQGVFANSDLSGDDLGVMFPALERIGDFAFYNVSSLSLSSNTVASIGFRAFLLSSLTSINLTNSVTFDQQAFEQSQLSTITLTENCTFADASVFTSVPVGGDAFVIPADETDPAIDYLKVTLGWSINP